MAIKQKRDKGLKIMMTETTYNRLHEVGEMLGQSPSTLASIAVSELVNKYQTQATVHDKAIKATVEALGPEFATQMKLMVAGQ